MRWRLRIAEYDLKLQYRNSKANTQADALSRLHTISETSNDANDANTSFFVDEKANDYKSKVLEPDYSDYDLLSATMDEVAALY